MNLVTVTFLDRNSRKHSLTYFSKQALERGDIVSVPIRGKPVPALVESIKEAVREKASIKASAIEFKKVSAVINRRSFSDTFLAAAEETARFYVVPLGAVIASVTPKTLLKVLPEHHPQTPARKETLSDTRIVQAEDAERLAQYRLLVRESFRRGESVFLLVPTIQDAESAATILSKGIEEHTILAHSAISSRQLHHAVKTIQDNAHPLLIVATPGFLALVPESTGMLIVEREHSSSYKPFARPHLDYRFFARALALHARMRLIVGDILPSTETVFIQHQEQPDENFVPKWRMKANVVRTLVDMRAYKPDLHGKASVLSDELKTLIVEMREAANRTVIFAGRKGLAPSTICGDCGSIVLCSRCEAPLVLHTNTNRKRWYLCHRCGEKQEAATRCRICTSWRLVAFGIGTELVEQKLAEVFPDLLIVRLDSDSVKSPREAQRLVERFYSAPGSVLVGTERILPYLRTPVGAVAVASVDELFSVPDFRMNERILYLLLQLYGASNRRFLLQTRHVEHPSITAALTGSIEAFYKKELEMRKALGYPPFSVPVKITVAGRAQSIARYMEQVSVSLLPYTLNVFPAFIKRGPGNPGLSGIVKIPQEKWPDEKIAEVLRSLPLFFDHSVDPESFW